MRKLEIGSYPCDVLIVSFSTVSLLLNRCLHDFTVEITISRKFCLILKIILKSQNFPFPWFRPNCLYLIGLLIPIDEVKEDERPGARLLLPELINIKAKKKGKFFPKRYFGHKL